jgi:S-(hydroxymethyl)glutathione dehydrogenase/alcohol dehydrogenase
LKAAVLTELNKPLKLAEVEPTALKYGQVLVQVLASGICGSQLQEIAGHKGNKPPHLLGHEGCGIVLEIGPGVTRVKPLDKVVMHWRKAAGIESEPPAYLFNDREITSGRVVTFAEEAICSENRLTPVPPETDRELCALLGCGLSTALGTLERDAAFRIGESLLVIGVGGLGCNLLRAGWLMHGHPIVGFDIKRDKGQLAKLMGASCCLSTWPSLCEEMQGYGLRAGFDCVIDTSGAPEAITRGLTMVRPSGRFIMVGQPAPGVVVALLNARHFFEGEGKTIKATQGGGFQPDLDIPRYVKIQSQLDASRIITHRMKLDQINDALDLVRLGDAGRVFITP